MAFEVMLLGYLPIMSVLQGTNATTLAWHDLITNRLLGDCAFGNTTTKGFKQI